MAVSNTRKLHGLASVAALIAASAIPVGCGDDGFSGCAASRTCEPSGDAGEAGDGSIGGSAGSGASGGSSGSGGAGGSSGTDATGGTTGEDMGGLGGMGGSPECSRDQDCDDDDPENGVESCDEGSCQPGNPPPQVISVTPADGATEVGVSAAVEIEFNEALDPDSVTSETIRVEIGSHVVAGDVEVDGTTVTFTPGERYHLLGRHTVTVTTDVTDEDGAGLLEAFQSSFDVREGAWATPTPLSASTIEPQLAVDGAGNVLVGWTTETSAFARWYRLAGGWGNIEPIATCSVACGGISVSANENGDAVVGAVADSTLWARQYRDGAWGLAENLGGSELRPRMAVRMSPIGEAHAFVARHNGQAGELAISRTNDRGVWQLGQPTTGEEITGDILDAIAFDASGNGLFLWSTSENLVHSRYSVASHTWSNRSNVTRGMSDAGTQVGNPSIAFDRAGNALAVYPLYEPSGSRIGSSTFDPASGFSGGPAASPYGGLASRAPGLAFDGEGFILAFTQVTGTEYRVFSNRYVGNAWAGVQQRDQGLFPARHYWHPKLAGDGRGSVTLVFRPETPGSDFDSTYFTRFSTTATAWSGPALAFTELAHWENFPPNVAFAPNGVGALAFRYNESQAAYEAGTWTTSLVRFE